MKTFAHAQLRLLPAVASNLQKYAKRWGECIVKWHYVCSKIPTSWIALGYNRAIKSLPADATAHFSFKHPIYAIRSSPLVERAHSECPVPLPSPCAQALSDYQRMVLEILANQSSMAPQQIRDALVPLLNILCDSTCLSPFASNLTCLNQTVGIDYTRRAVCGRNGNTFCPIEFVNLVIDGINPIPTCASSGSCSPSCRNNLTTIANRLGCCAASWFTISGSPFASVGNQYRTCGVSLGSVCAAAGAGSTTAHYLSALLLFAASALAIVVF